jgi:histidinol-phosphate aminotransferase
MKLKPRREVAGFEPYLPGRSLEQVKREYNLKKVVKLASNENSWGPSPRVIDVLRQTAGQVFRYPDGFSTDLRKALVRELGVKITQITLGAGSDEIIEMLAKVYLNPGDQMVVSEHAFIRYQMAGELMGASVVTVPMKNLTHDLGAMARAVTARTKFVFVASPNNPTGTYNTIQEMKAFLKALPTSVLPVIDEAYFEYARDQPNYPDAVELFKSGRPLVALRTFSKAYALAGVRLGYGVAPEDLVEALERVRPPFNMSVPAQVAGIAALEDKTHVRKSVRLTQKEKTRVGKALTALGFSWTPSAGNFLLVKVYPRRGTEVFDSLVRKGVIVRSLDEYNLPHHIRVTIGRSEENRMFLNAIKEVKP